MHFMTLTRKTEFGHWKTKCFTMYHYRPTTLHFFQPLNHDFFTNFAIPKQFWRLYLERQEEKGEAVNEEMTAKLREKCRKKVWDVKVVRNEGDPERLKFEDGWQQFCEEHTDLGVGDFMVFRHHANFDFHVSFYGPNGLQKTGYKERSNEKASLTPTGPPLFHALLKSYSVKSNFVYIPTKFAKRIGLYRKWCEMELLDEEGQVWPMLLRRNRNLSKGDRTYIYGWRLFQEAHGLKSGDGIAFELIHPGQKPLIKCYRNFKGLQSVGGKDCTKPRSAFPCCSVIVKQPHFLNFPTAFTRENGLTNRRGQVEIIDEKGRKWSTPLRQHCTFGYAYVVGFRPFYEANGLNPGDRLIVEIINPGEKLVIKAYTTTTY